MASASYCTIFLLLLVAIYLCKATDFNILDFEMAWKHELWMAKHGRTYKDEAEKARRFEIFKENIKYIEDFNSVGGHKYILGEGPFTDLTAKEFMAIYASGLEEYSPKSLKHEMMEPVLNYTAPPSSVDWRAKGAVSSVKNQGYTCGNKIFLRVIIFLCFVSILFFK